MEWVILDERSRERLDVEISGENIDRKENRSLGRILDWVWRAIGSGNMECYHIMDFLVFIFLKCRRTHRKKLSEIDINKVEKSNIYTFENGKTNLETCLVLWFSPITWSHTVCLHSKHETDLQMGFYSNQVVFFKFLVLFAVEVIGHIVNDQEAL